MVGHHTTIRVLEAQDQVAVIKGPGRVTMEHEKGFVAGTFIQVMIAQMIQLQGMRRKGIKLCHHSIPIIRQLSPLPIPSKAALSPVFSTFFSIPMANVVGNEAAPVLPRNSRVEKSF